MADQLLDAQIPLPETFLRELARNPSQFMPDFSRLEADLGVKRYHDVFDLLLDTADAVDLPSPQRTAAYNALCAATEYCQASDAEYARNAILEKSIWQRQFNIYLQRSDNAKGKSMRNMLSVLTNVLLTDESTLSLEVRDKAASSFIEIICERQDRPKVKPALQGLAYFLQKDLLSISKLIGLYQQILLIPRSISNSGCRTVHEIITSFLSWAVHHDTSLAAGHLIRKFLDLLRRSTLDFEYPGGDKSISFLWIEPVVDTLHSWPDRIQEFKTNVFPHCFLPNIKEYLHFLSYLRFGHHICKNKSVPEQLLCHHDHENMLKSSEEFSILLAAIQTGKELGIVKDIDYRQLKRVEISEDALFLPDDIFGAWLSSPEPDVRLAGLFLSVYSTATTKPITGGVFKSLRSNLGHLHSDTDASFRKELLSQIQRLFDRLKGSTAALARTQIGRSNHDGSRLPVPTQWSEKDPLKEPLEFMMWYVRFVVLELRPTSSYQRRITSLRSLSILLKCGLDPRIPHRHLSKSAQGQLRWAHGISMVDFQLFRSLMDLVLDPFDDIRGASISLLELCLDSLSDQERGIRLEIMPRFIQRAENMMLQTGRADQADGVARAYSLLFSQRLEHLPASLPNDGIRSWTRISILERLTNQLDATIEVAQRDLSKAVNGRPVHGIFAALRYIVDQESFYADMLLQPTAKLQTWKNVHGRMWSLSEKLWSCVRDVLCADAPEGHVPDEIDEEVSLDTKEILSYSWRGLKEASILIRTIVSRAPIGSEDVFLIKPDDFERIGRLCFTQLVELRHRGAFSTVAQTFAAFCRRSAAAKDDRLKGLPEKWYKETLLCIQDKAASITRRSAGIPSLMTGIIAAEQQQGGSFFNRAMKDLITEASREARSSNIEESRLPQVHALNCIKDIFTTSKLSAASEAFIGEGLDLAARTLNSTVWPIRNCSLMLFKALIERLLGSDEAQDWKEEDRMKTSRFSYNNYPALVGILTALLDPNGPLKKSMTPTVANSPLDLHGAEGVFPALQIIRQAPPPESHRPVIRESVMHLLGSPHWHLRDMAARTLISLHHPHEYHDTISRLMTSLEGPHNFQHGVLLGLRYMLRKYLRSPQKSPIILTDILQSLQGMAPAMCDASSCPMIESAFIDLVNICGMSILQNRHRTVSALDAWSKLHSYLTTGIIHLQDRVEGGSLLQRSIKQCLLIGDAALDIDYEKEGITGILSPSFREALLELSDIDPDTGYEALEALGDIIRSVQSSSLTGPRAHLILILPRVTTTAKSTDVRAKAQSILAEALQNAEIYHAFFKNRRAEQILHDLEELELQCIRGPPSNMQSALRLLGIYLDFVFHHYPARQFKRPLEHIARYIRLLRMTIVDTNPFDARFAAVQSISALKYIWTADPEYKPTSTLILGLAFVLYGMLNDDDDEIRDAAAVATSKLLTAQKFQPSTKEAVPIMTVQRLTNFLIHTFPASRDLCKEALRGLVGTQSHGQLFARSFADILADERKEDTSLFVQEKQNLFKDDAMDAALWANVLKSVPFSSASSVPTTSLTEWVLDGLAALTETARTEVDGPLGWTTKAEVFTLGMRVMCAADVALKWNVPGASTIRLALREFADVGAKSEVNGLWMGKVEKVIERSVLDIVRRVHHSLPSL